MEEFKYFEAKYGSSKIRNASSREEFTFKAEITRERADKAK